MERVGTAMSTTSGATCATRAASWSAKGPGDIHELTQAGYAPGTRRDAPLCLDLPGHPLHTDPAVEAARSGGGSL
jgi:hypothetical protein